VIKLAAIKCKGIKLKEEKMVNKEFACGKRMLNQRESKSVPDFG
jgi:hypothetical protein